MVKNGSLKQLTVHTTLQGSHSTVELQSINMYINIIIHIYDTSRHGMSPTYVRNEIETKETANLISFIIECFKEPNLWPGL